MGRFLTFFGILLTVTILFFGCNSSPTVPVPPPAATLIKTTVPDSEGFVTVTGEADDRFGFGDIALVFNDSTGNGAMKDIATDGSFETRIQAQVSHILVIQVQRDGSVSEGTEIVVEDQ